VDAPGRGDQGADLAAPDEPAATELDALHLAGSGPATDGRRLEPDVRRRQDSRGLLEADPVARRRSHRQSSELVEVEDAPLEELEPPVDPDSVDAADEVEPRSVADPSFELESFEPELLLAFVVVPLVDERSFFAQPEPLKWIAGLTSALRIVPSRPQLGQKRGPASLIPWITSTRCLQLEQM
jgi:hypothetical protein